MILEMEIRKIAFEVTGDVRRWLGWRRAFCVYDGLQLSSSEHRIALIVNEHLNV